MDIIYITVFMVWKKHLILFVEFLCEFISRIYENGAHRKVKQLYLFRF